MRLWWLALGVLVLVLAVPTASACSLAGEPEDPARFYIWDSDLGKIVAHTTVEERRLGADCSLSTVYDIERGRLAWPDSRQGVEPGIMLWSFLTEEKPTRVSEGGIEHGWHVDLVGDHIVHHSRYLRDPQGDHTSENRYNEFRTIHMESGEERVLPLDDGKISGAILEDGHIHWTEKGSAGNTLSIYDAIAEAYHIEDTPLSAFGLPPDAELVAANSEWLVFMHRSGEGDDRDYRAWVYETAIDAASHTMVPDPARLHEFPAIAGWPFYHHVALDGDHLYRRDAGSDGHLVLNEYDLETRTLVASHPVPDLPRTSTFRMSDGRTVYGTYAGEGPPQDVETIGGEERPVDLGDDTGPDPEEDGKTVTLPTAGSLSLVLLVGLLLRRRR